jgi:hypothetical protein
MNARARAVLWLITLSAAAVASVFATSNQEYGPNEYAVIDGGLSPDHKYSIAAHGGGDPTLEIHDNNGNIIAANDNWEDSQGVDIQATGIPPTDSREAAILLRLSPAAYTAVMRGKDNSIGVGLIEAYQLNP